MADQSNQPLFGQPVVSPEALRSRRALAEALIKQGTEYSPILSKWQGLARVADSIRGNIELGMSERSEAETRRQLIEDAIKARSGGDPAEMLKLGLNPFVAERLAGELVSKSFPQNLDTGGYITPQSQISGRPAAPSYERQLPGTFSTPNASMPGYVTPSQSGVGPGMGGPAPRPPAPPPVQPSGMRPATFDERFSAASPAASGAGTVMPERLRQLSLESNALEAQRIGTTTQASSNAGLLAEHRKVGQDAKLQIADLQTLQDLGRRAGYGLPAEIKTFIGQRLGVDPGGLTENQAYLAFLNRYAPVLRPEGSGGLKTAELTGFTNSLGGLSTTREGRELAVATMGKIANYKVRAGEIAAGPGTDEQKLDAIRKLEIPQIDYDRVKELTKQRTQGGGWTVQRGGREYYKDPQSGDWFMR